MFMGSGTTLFECELLNRNYIGFDINEDMIEYVEGKMKDTENIQYFIHNNDITDTPNVKNNIESDLKQLNKKNIDLIISHPPYWDIVKFTDKKEDLSNIIDLDDFVSTCISSVKNVWESLKKKGTFVMVIGDVYKNSEVVPLGFHLMNAIKENFNCLLKGIVVKDMVNNRGKIGTEGIHRYRALKFGYYIFKHEYIFVFQKK
jgi:DNA modification methylase